MTTLLLDCSARGEVSVSRELSRYLAESLGESVVHRDLEDTYFPPISGRDLIDLHNARRLDRDSLVQHHFLADELIDEIRSASSLVVGVPIYNFSVPTVLRQWIDYVLQPGITFKYEPGGPVGLCDNISNAYIVTASGGTPVGGSMDFASSYFEFICRFIGVSRIQHIDAGGSKREREQIISQGKSQINGLLSSDSHLAAR